MKTLPSSSSKAPVKFRMPTKENLVPIRLDIELEEQRYKDAFTWNPIDPDSEITIFAKTNCQRLEASSSFYYAHCSIHTDTIGRVSIL
ncbi:hypothetical protein OIU84_018363 [Salix udensis]|uniref:Uncharacterized protein n=1 Tax=Salix udensis TaxID=889485 RepID=A0AAD6PHS5_9ROSI|nr:hypothetical protein OIU84_018363 [Salix udensis]